MLTQGTNLFLHFVGVKCDHLVESDEILTSHCTTVDRFNSVEGGNVGLNYAGLKNGVDFYLTDTALSHRPLRTIVTGNLPTLSGTILKAEGEAKVWWKLKFTFECCGYLHKRWRGIRRWLCPEESFRWAGPSSVCQGAHWWYRKPSIVSVKQKEWEQNR